MPSLFGNRRGLSARRSEERQNRNRAQESSSESNNSDASTAHQHTSTEDNSSSSISSASRLSTPKAQGKKNRVPHAPLVLRSDADRIQAEQAYIDAYNDGVEDDSSSSVSNSAISYVQTPQENDARNEALGAPTARSGWLGAAWRVTTQAVSSVVWGTQNMDPSAVGAGMHANTTRSGPRNKNIPPTAFHNDLFTEDALRADEEAIFPVEVAVPVTMGAAGVRQAQEGRGTDYTQPAGPRYVIGPDGNLILLPPDMNYDQYTQGINAFDDRLDASGATHGSPHSLLDAIRLYKQNPSDYHTNLCLTYLSARGADEFVSPEELAETTRNRFLVKLFIEKGALDFNSPAVISELQACVDEWIGVDPPYSSRRQSSAHHPNRHAEPSHNPDASTVVSPNSPDSQQEPVEGMYIDGSMAEYLKAVFTTRYIRITATQQKRMYKSGFEFGKLMYDYPHVVSDIPSTPRSRAWWVKWTRRVQPLLMVLTFGLMAYDHFTLGYILYQWNAVGSGANFQFYLSIIVYIATLILMSVAIFIALKMKPLTIYAEDGAIVPAEFPTHYLKLIPLGLELQICSTYFRELLRCGHGAFEFHVNARQSNLFLMHDLWALISLSHIIHTAAVTLVQLLIHSYYFSMEDDDTETYDGVQRGFNLLLTAAWPSLSFAILVHCIVTSVFYCVTNLGFVRLSSEIEKKSMSIFSRLVGVILLYLFLCNIFFLLVAIINFGTCNTNMIIWVSVAGVIVIFTIVVYSWAVYNSGNIITAAKWCVPPMICQGAFTIYINSSGSQKEGDECQMFFLIGGVNIVVGYVGWGALLVIVAVWGTIKVYDMYRREQEQEADRSTPRQEQIAFKPINSTTTVSEPAHIGLASSQTVSNIPYVMSAAASTAQTGPSLSQR